MRLAQSLGAFSSPEAGISPLHVFFEVGNAGDAEVEVDRIYVTASGDPAVVHEIPLGPDRPRPLKLAPGASARFHTRAKALAGDLKRAGHEGRPKVTLVVEDALGDRVEKTFRFRVDEYLALKDE